MHAWDPGSVGALTAGSLSAHKPLWGAVWLFRPPGKDLDLDWMWTDPRMHRVQKIAEPVIAC